MKVLLIQPPIRDFYRTRFREYPMGLLYLASALKRNGHDAVILDARFCKKARIVELPAELAHLKSDYVAENRLGKFRRFGMNYADIAAKAVLINPDAVCISSLFTAYSNEVIETALAIKKVMPQIMIVVGGHHATADPNHLSRSGAFDLVVRGEGEEVISRIISDRTYSTIYPASDHDSLCIDSLDVLSPPARHLIDGNVYRLGGRPYTMMLTSRGCPHNCSFCSVHCVAGIKHRTRSIDAVMDEIEECVVTHGIRAIDFQDDNLLFDRDRIKDLFDRIARKNYVDCEFLASNGLNAAHLDDELLELMKKIGFKKLDIALATGDVGFRKNLYRPENVEKYEQVLAKASHLGLAVTTYIIIGIPTQPIKEMIETVEYLKHKPTRVVPSVFYNVPGMPIYNEMLQYELEPSHSARRSTAFNCNGKDFSREEIVELFWKIIN